MSTSVTQSQRVWHQLIDAVSHTVLGERRGGGVGSVPEAFEVFHLEIEGAEDVARALDAAKTLLDRGVYIGIFGSRSAAREHSLLELWCIERTDTQAAPGAVATPPAASSRGTANNTKAEQTALRLLLRSLYMGCRLLPLGSSRVGGRKKVGFFIVPIEGYDPKTGVLQPGQASTSMGDCFEGVAKFESLQEQRKWSPVTVGSQNSPVTMRVSVTHTAGVPDVSEVCVPDGGAQFSIIGDYVNRGEPHSVVQAPFTRQKRAGGVPSSAAIPIQRSVSSHRGGAVPPSHSHGAHPVASSSRSHSHSSANNSFGNNPAVAFGYSNPQRIPSFGGTPGLGATPALPFSHPASTPPPFALTPTPSSLQSASSFNKAFAKGVGDAYGTARHSVSPPDGSQMWAPRFEPCATGAWAPKNDEGAAANLLSSQQDIAPYMAFLEEDDLDGVETDYESEDVSHGQSVGNIQPGSRILHSDDDVSRFRERMEAVSLTTGFPSSGGAGGAATNESFSGMRSPFSASMTGAVLPQKTVRDMLANLEDMKSEFMAAQR